ncbi:MAG: FG-GAP repeat protein [Anaerolineae bacterium]|nr:FG-GAP repeat protein [Anaerolineae bacterium]
MTYGIRLTVVALILSSLLIPVPVLSEGAPPGLTGGGIEDSNASFVGQATGEQGGYSVAIAGDVNGDGYDDLVIGAPYYNSGNGRAYIFFGEPGGWQLDEDLGNADAALYLGSGWTGFSVAGAGDVNGDGFDDIIVGSPGYVSTGCGSLTDDCGRVDLIFGSATLSGAISPLTTQYAVGDRDWARFGYSVSGVGDVDGDGYDDILIGAPAGTTAVGDAAGQATLWRWNGAVMTVSNYQGSNAGDEAGLSVGGAGDVDGDGYADMLIGAYGHNGATGRTYLVAGSSSPTFGDLDAVAYRYYDGENSGDQSGSCVTGAGDVNGDGYADFLVGATNYNGGYNGRAYLVLGDDYMSITSLINVASATYNLTSGSNFIGLERTLAGAGDVNGDGYADILIGAYGADSNRGWVYLVLGSAHPSGDMDLNSVGILYEGYNAGNYTGRSLSGGGDIDGDGYGDFVVGAYGYNANQGRAYLVFSDYDSSSAARYRLMNPLAMLTNAVGYSDVSVTYTSGVQNGSVYVTRHYVNTCGQDYDTNGLLWRVDSQRGSSAQANITFKYNLTQIAGWTEGNLMLWYRDRPCQDWTQDAGAVLDTTRNTLTSSSVTDVHREYTIAPVQPSPTQLGAVSFETSLFSEPLWLVGLSFLGLAGVIAEWWRKRKREQASS